jgi:hypothetical protein
MMGGVDQELYIGRKAQELRGLLRIKYPVAHGIVGVGQSGEQHFMGADGMETG